METVLRTATSVLRSADGRAILYQVAIVGAVLAVAYAMASRAVRRLAELGIQSGYDFLTHRAGFDVGERVPLPRLEPELLVFAASVVAGIFAVWALSRWAAGRGTPAAADTRLAVLRMVLLFGFPAIALAVSGQGLEADDYTADSSVRQALVIGILNTLRVSAIALVLSTVVGLVVALMRLSPNWVLRALGRAYVELIRNLPLLLHLFFWYFAVLRSLPSVRQSLSVGDMVFINNRGVYVPDPLAEPGLAPFAIAVAVALFVVYLVVRIGRDVAEKTGRRLPVVALSMVALVGIPGLAVLFHGAPLSFTTPVLKGFNFRDALVLTPEFATLIVALTVYHGAYAAEVIRSGIQSVPHGTVEAARSLALPKRHVFRFVVMPLAFRVIIPPMISRYLGLIKSSSLGVAVGYPEIVSIGNSIEYATGQSIELVILVMAFYLSISLTISIWLNWYNARVQLKSDR